VALALGPAAVVRTQDPPQTGPLDVVTSPQMPSDSLAAAMAELEVLRTAGTSLSAARASLARRASVLEADATRSTRALDRARTGLDRLRAETVRAYLSTSGRAPRASALATARVETLGTAARRALVRRVAAHEHALRAHRRAARRVAASLTVHDRAVLDVTQQVAVLTAKVAAASNEIAPSGAVAPAAPGPTAIARLAVGAARALGTPAPEDDHDARSSLADAVTREADARSDGADAALLVSEWAATPVPALRAVFFGLSQVGKPYVYAAAGPDAYDCSGFTRRAWQEHGIALPHFSGAQLRAGLPVAPEQVRPGDLLAYGPGGAEHVTLAIGAGLDVEAKGRARGVVVDTADVSPSGGRFAGASRPVP
jgi:cell wall-associated NlpC family hydrolase